VLAVVYARYATRPVRPFLATTLAMLALSPGGPLTATQATRRSSSGYLTGAPLRDAAGAGAGVAWAREARRRSFSSLSLP
jgi:hypothetical protein